MSNQSEKIRSINSVGWDGVNSNAQPFPNKNEQSDVDMQYALCFQTEAGRKVLEHLENIPDGNVSLTIEHYRVETITLSDKSVSKLKVKQLAKKPAHEESDSED